MDREGVPIFTIECVSEKRQNGTGTVSSKSL